STSTPSHRVPPRRWWRPCSVWVSPSRACSDTTISTRASRRSVWTCACSWTSSLPASLKLIQSRNPKMSGGGGGDKDVYDEINVTPMLDLAYVLLIIFIILCTATVQGIKVNLPKASAQPSLAENKTKAISITADGTIYLDTFPVTLPELENLLRQYKSQTPDLPVIIKADSSIPYQRVVDVLDLVGRLEISQLGLVTQKLVK